MFLVQNAYKIDLLVGSHIMDNIKILDWLCLPRVIDETCNWIIPILVNNASSMDILVEIQVNNVINILDYTYLIKVMGESGIWITVEGFLPMVN